MTSEIRGGKELHPVVRTAQGRDGSAHSHGGRAWLSLRGTGVYAQKCSRESHILTLGTTHYLTPPPWTVTQDGSWARL